MKKNYRVAFRQIMPFWLIFILSLYTESVYSADWYVSNTGNDGNSGSVGSPKLTIQAAINAASAGDFIYVNPGTYTEFLIIDKSLTLQGISSDKSLQKLDGTGLGTKSGIVINSGVTNVTIKNITIQNFTGSGGNSHAGIYGIANNNNLTVTNVALLNNTNSSGFYANGPISTVSITNSVVNNNGSGARGIVLWNGFKQNITISNNQLSNNNCCGIELQDGTGSNVQINGNTIDISGGDNGIGVSGLNNTVGANTISNNTITGGGRFGIEIKNPAGGVTVSGNNVTLSTQNSDLRDRAGIAVFRRGKMAENVDVPNGVTISGNTVTGYQQTSTSEGFGIVIEGTNHSVTGNTLINNEVGILQQQNPSNYSGDADQNNVSDLFFGRGNSPMTCGNSISGNTFSGNMTDSRNAGGIGAGLVTNTNTNEYFCSIQPAIDDTDTQNGHTITVAAGTFSENVNVTKSLTISGPNKMISPNNGSRVTEAIITGGVNVDNAASKTIVIEGFQFQGVTSPLNYNGNLGNTVVLNITFRKNLINSNSGQLAIFTGSGTNTANATIQDNRFLSMSSNAMQLNSGSGGVTTAQITDNTIMGAGNAGMNLALTNSLINGNTISNTVQQGIQVADASGNVTVSNNVITNTNTGADANRGGIRVRGTSFTGPVNITNNIISGSTNGISVPTGEDITGKAISVTNNDLSGNTFGIKNSGTGSLSATCNWFGGTGSTVSPLISGSVTFEPFLSNGTDNDGGAIGFQPVPNSCSGCAGGGTVQNTTTGEYFCSIQAAIDDADTQNGHTITVAAGTYKEDVNVTKQLTINGAGIDVATIEGPIGGTSNATIRISAMGVVINGFTITRAGNNTTDWYNPSLNSAGLSVQGQTNTVEVMNSKFVGNRTAIDVNNSNGNNIHNNIITNNRTGVLFRNQTDNTTFTQNEVTDNWTVGVLFLDASSGSNSPVQTALTSTFSQNKITGNWYGGVVDRQTGGSLPAPGSNLKGFNCNWYGSISPVISSANSTEPSYDTQLIPVSFGGTASNPGGAPDIAGPASANIQYAPFLSVGTDNDGLTVGFQPVPGSCSPCVGTATIGTATTICQGGNTTITVTGTPNTSVTYNINGSGSYTLALNGTGTGTFNTGALSSTTTYNLVSGINGSCTSSLTGSVTITVNLNHSIALSSASGTDAQASCIGTSIVPITYTLGGAASGVNITGLPTGVTYAVTGNVLTISGIPTVSGVFPYTIVTTGPCVTTSTTGTLTVNVKPQIKIVVNTSEFTEGNNATLCDIDANPSNNTLASTVTTSCLSGTVLWRTKIGSGAWSEWTATAPSLQPSDNTEYQYQASCNACPATITNAIAIKINYRASTPQNVSMVADGTTILAGQSATICDQEGNTLVFNATCAAGESLIYSVDGGDYSATIPTQMIDGNLHNYRVRCRKADGTPSCVETESAAMTLKLTTITVTPTATIAPLTSCTTSSVFSGNASCGSFATVWYDASTNQLLANLPTTPPTTTSSFYARCKNAEGCLSAPSNTVTYTVLPVNVAPVVTASADAVCTGASVTLSTNCPSGASVLWNTSATDAVLTVAFNNVTTQSYSAQCIFANGCQTPFSEPKKVLWKAFDITLINIGQTKSAVKSANDKALWTSQFITKDGGPELDFSTQTNPTLYFTENLNKMAPRYWTIYSDACALGTNGSLTFDMLAAPEVGAPRSFNTHENNAPYFMYANREGWTELYAPNHQAYGFYQDNGAGGNVYDEGLPKGLYKLSVRYWDMKGWGSIYPSTRQPQGTVLAYQEYWFRVQSKDGVGVGSARVAADLNPSEMAKGAFAEVMPNPVSNVLRLQVQGSKGQEVEAQLLDIAGRQMLGRKFIAETNQHQEEFEVGELPTGMYLMKVIVGDKQLTLKVIKR